MLLFRVCVVVSGNPPHAKFFCLFLLWLCIKCIARRWGMLRECTLGSYRVLELKSSFLIKKCAPAAKHLVGCLKEMPESFRWNGCGSIKLQQYSSVISSWVSLSFSNLSSVGADKCGGMFNWMMGLTASCKTKVNCSGEDTLLNCTTACATCAMWLCASCR